MGGRDTCLAHLSPASAGAGLCGHWHKACTGPGAIQIIDKTLTIKGEHDNIISGPGNITAFYIQDLDYNNDVTIDGLSFQNFKIGIDIFHYDPDIEKYSPNGRNITIKNCTFFNINRYHILLVGVQGDILIQDNEIQQNDMSTRVRGIYIWWPGERQPETLVHIVGNEINTFYPGWNTISIYTRNSSNVEIIENKITSNYIGIQTTTCRNINIEKNIIKDAFLGSSTYVSIKGMVLSSNTFINCQYGLDIYGLDIWGDSVLGESEGAVIENNRLNNIKVSGIEILGDACFGHIVRKNEINMAPESLVSIFYTDPLRRWTPWRGRVYTLYWRKPWG